MAPRPAVDRRLQRLASAFTPEWLAAQRWYRAKSRAVERVELTDAGEIAGSSGWLLVLEATDADGNAAQYLVPAALDGEALREPADGDGVWSALAGLMLAGGEIAGDRGRWAFNPMPMAAERLRGHPLGSSSERRLGVQQSNTSVALGDALILKVYRLVEPGMNPEVEMNEFLTDVGFRAAPVLGGSATYLVDGDLHSAAMLQELVPSAGDGWSWMLGRLSDRADGPAEALAAVSEIGRLTAEMHAALASRPDQPGFPARPATGAELAGWERSAHLQLTTALSALEGEQHDRLERLAPAIAAGLEGIDSALHARVSRIHGDYHLGQLLRTTGGFRVIDFEGEPARPLAERRAPASPLRDVAGMLRSLDYASHASEGPGAATGLGVAWLTEARASLLSGYGGIKADDAPLLAAFEIEKACYEVAYEANNRPDWVWLPLEALERQLRAD